MSASFAAWLGYQLKSRGWNQAELARKVGVRSGTVSRWMNGQRPDTEFCERIADVLHLSPDIVLTKAGHRPEPTEAPTDSPENRIISLVKRIDWTEDGLERHITRVLNGFIEDQEAAGKK